jgi:cyclic pyranopterin phosphate synthase
MLADGAKSISAREASGTGRVSLAPATIRQIRAGNLKKGDPLQTARLAGIMAAKRTSELIPLCHPLAITFADVSLAPARDGYRIEATVRTAGQTGVEMEALTAASVAALTIYDMCKAVDRGMTIESVRLLEKLGGKSGHFQADQP